jgi:hypothetical protein
MDIQLTSVQNLAQQISCSCLGIPFHIRVERDNKNPINGRIFVQICYQAPCSKAGSPLEWHGRKWYLSEHMTDDEIVKTIYAAFETAIKHEIMEGFKVNGIILFNPHTHYKALLNVSHNEVSRPEHPAPQTVFSIL